MVKEGLDQLDDFGMLKLRMENGLFESEFSGYFFNSEVFPSFLVCGELDGAMGPKAEDGGDVVAGKQLVFVRKLLLKVHIFNLKIIIPICHSITLIFIIIY